MQYKRKNRLAKKRVLRTRLKITGTTDCPRVAVFRSLRHIYAQIIDDLVGNTLVSCSTQTPELREALTGKKKSEQATIVGEHLGKLAIEKGIEKVVFDRHGKRYAGRIKALADGSRKAGLKF